MTINVRCARFGRLVSMTGATVTAVAVVVASAVMFAPPAHASARFGYFGYAHGSIVGSGLANHGPQVASFFGCTRQVGLYRSNTLATVNVGGQVVARSVATQTYTHNDSRGDGTTSYGAAASTTVGSLLQVSGARSYARAVYLGGRFQTQSWARFAEVKIGGIPRRDLLNPAPNTTVSVPGLGFVQFNRVDNAQTTQSANARNTAMLIYATVPNPYLPKGASVVVLANSAAVGGSSVALLRGKAYATQASVGTTLTSGPTSLQSTCLGTDGKLRTVNVAGVTIPNAGTLNGLTTSQAGSIRTDLATGNMSASVAGAALASGRIRLSTVTARASATKTSAGKYYTSSSSTVGSLVIDGRRVSVPTAPNQQLTVPGLGYLVFNKTSRTTSYITVTAVEVHLNLSTTKAVIHISRAEAGIIG